MDFRQLNENDAKEFSALIVDMYNHLENLEWFSPMQYDEENVKGLLTNPRFFVLGAFENNTLCGVSSFDFKCGKLIGQSFMPTYCSLDNTVEIGFTMVHSHFLGHGIMKQLIRQLEKQALLFDKQYIFGKVHVDNKASYLSFAHSGYNEFSQFEKAVKQEDFTLFLSAGLLMPSTAEKAKLSLQNAENDVHVKYAILIKTLRRQNENNKSRLLFVQ